MVKNDLKANELNEQIKKINELKKEYQRTLKETHKPDPSKLSIPKIESLILEKRIEGTSEEIKATLDELGHLIDIKKLSKILFEMTQQKKLIFQNNTYKIPPQIPQKIP